MEYLSLIFLHVAFGIFWAGAVAVLGFFILPSVLDAGPAGGAVMAGVVKRKMPTALLIAGIVVVLSGVRLYMVRFSASWMTTGEGIVISLGALLGVAAFAMGVFIQRPTVDRIGKLAAGIAKAGGPPTSEQATEMKALQARLRTVARLTAWHILGASVLMASHRLVAMF
jgi:hypothetical protein